MGEELKAYTRREFFNEVCSKDSIKEIFGAWYTFKKEANKTKEISCDEAGLRLSRKSKEITKNLRN